MLNELLHESIPVILNEDDLNSMLFSIENRSPYLDSKLFEFAYSIPNEHLIKNGYAKSPLRKALAGILVDEVRLDRKKIGFNASLESLIDIQSGETSSELLSPSAIYNIVNRDEIVKLLKVKNLPNSYSKFLFNFINAKIFIDLFE
jgi:asparagine synthase (glutamine-hydrolysing)